MNQVPLLDGVTTYAADFIFPGGAANNKLHFEKDVTFATTLSEDQRMILWDPQTSGASAPCHSARTIGRFSERLRGAGTRCLDGRPSDQRQRDRGIAIDE